MRVYHSRPALDAEAVELPPNLSFTPMFGNVLDSMLRHSPAFRRQCLRLAKAPWVTVAIRNVNPSPLGARARTRVVPSGGGVLATVEIPPLDDIAELIAHELEHVIEQIDGVDLKAQAARTGTGVTECDVNVFETVRAVRTGKLVARETRLRR